MPPRKSASPANRRAKSPATRMPSDARRFALSRKTATAVAVERPPQVDLTSVSGKLLGFLGTFPPQYEPLGTERSSRAELPCGALRREPRKFDEGVTSSPPFKTLSRVFG